MKTSTAVAAGVGVVLVLGVAVLGFGVGFKESVEFRLAKDGAGICQPSDPDPIVGGWLHKVKWTVTNVDCDPQYIALKNFKPTPAGGSPVAVVNPDPVVGGPIATGAAADVTAKIEKFALGSRYKYEIWVGPTAATVVMRRDPDIEIWP